MKHILKFLFIVLLIKANNFSKIKLSIIQIDDKDGNGPYDVNKRLK